MYVGHCVCSCELKINLMLASAKFKADKKIVLKTVRQNGNMLEYASKELK